MTVLTSLWSHQVELKASPISASNARSFVSWCLVEHRLLYLVDPVRLVASDLATNALVHQTPFTVTLSQPDHTVLLTVRDNSKALAVHGAVADTQGRGLNIVDMVSLDCGQDRDVYGRRFAWASFALRPGRER